MRFHDILQPVHRHLRKCELINRNLTIRSSGASFSGPSRLDIFMVTLSNQIRVLLVLDDEDQEVKRNWNDLVLYYLEIFSDYWNDFSQMTYKLGDKKLLY